MTYECPICLDTLKYNIVTTYCNHQFHKECIELWYKYNHNCPICRLSFYKKYKCIDSKFGLKYNICIKNEYLIFSNIFYSIKYYYHKIQKIECNNKYFIIFYFKNNKIKIKKYTFKSFELCEHFFRLIKNKLTT